MAEKSDARQKLEARAKELELSFPGNIGDEKLAERVAQAEAEKAGTKDNPESPKTSQAAAAAGDEGAAKAAGQTGPAATQTAGSEQTSPQMTQSAGGDGAGPGAPAPAATATVTVTGPKRGRWRCGRQFGPEAVSIPFADLDEDELAALEADPVLTVTVVDAPY